MTGGRRGRDLTLIPSPVSMRGRFDPEKPILRVQLVDRLEPQVRRVRQSTDRQQVRVVVTQPGDLQSNQ